MWFLCCVLVPLSGAWASKILRRLINAKFVNQYIAVSYFDQIKLATRLLSSFFYSCYTHWSPHDEKKFFVWLGPNHTSVNLLFDFEWIEKLVFFCFDILFSSLIYFFLRIFVYSCLEILILSPRWFIVNDLITRWRRENWKCSVRTIS